MLKGLAIFLVFLTCSICLNAQQAKLILPEGHTEGVRLMDYSPDGNYLLTATTEFGDRTARVWEIKSGKLVYSLKGHLLPIINAVFSPDGKYILTNNIYNYLWDAQTGSQLNITDTISSGATCFSADSKYLIFSNYEKEGITFWDIANKKIERTINTEGLVYRGIKITHSGNYLIGYSSGNDSLGQKPTVSVWETSSGKKIFSQECQLAKNLNIYLSNVAEKALLATDKEFFLLDCKNKSAVRNATLQRFEADNNRCIFSDDGKHLYIAADKNIYQFNAENFKPEKTADENRGNIAAISMVPGRDEIFSIDYDGFLVLYKADSLRYKAAYETNYGRTNGLKVSPSGKTFAISTFNKYTIVVNLPDLTYATLLSGSAASMWKLETAPALDKLCINSSSGDIRIADPETGKLIRRISYDSGRIEKPKFSFDGKKIITSAEGGKKLICWDVETGKYLFDVKAFSFIFYNYCFNPNGKTFVTWEAVENKLTIRDAENGKELYKYFYPKKGGKGNAITYTADGKWLLISNYYSVEIREGNTGKLVRTLKGPALTDFEINEMAISPDAGTIAAITSSHILAWNFTSGKKIMEHYQDNKKDDDETDFLNVHFSPDSKKILLPLNNGRSIVLDVANDTLEKVYGGHYEYSLLDAAYTPDQKKIITIGGKFGYMLFNDNPDDEKDNLTAGETSEEINGYTFSKSGREIITISENSLRKYNIETGRLLYKTIFINNTDWLTYDTAGRFDGTETARKLLYFTCGKEIIELEQVKDLLWVPNLAERINNGDSITSKTLSGIDICGLTPLAETTNDDKENYKFTITSRRGGLGDVILLVNGIEARRYKKEQLIKNDSRYELVVTKKELEPFFINGQGNKVTLKALTADNVISSRSIIVDEDRSNTASTPPNLFAVIVGVSDYKGIELDLKYAAKDAGDISLAIATAGRKLLNTDSINHVFVYNFTTDGKSKQLPEKNNIKNALAEIGGKATANDILLIFFAGHGVMEGEHKQFYFLTADASQATATTSVAEVGISTAELTDWMKPDIIKAQKRVLIFDACNSGQAINDLIKIGSNNQNYLAARDDDKAQQIKAIDKLNEKSGLFILSAAASNQSAYEMSKYSQGILTFSLLRAIKEQPDVLNNGRFLDLGKWFNAAKEYVEELSRDNGARQEPQIVSNTNFIIGLVDDEVQRKIILPREKPVFDASNFQNTDIKIADDDLELSKLLNRKLIEISSLTTNNTIIYAHGTSSPDAYTLTGRYTVTGNNITVRVNIKQNKKIKQQFDVSGNKETLPGLITEIITRASQVISQLK